MLIPVRQHCPRCGRDRTVMKNNQDYKADPAKTRVELCDSCSERSRKPKKKGPPK